MLRKIILIATLMSGALLAGCAATVPMESLKVSNAAKEFKSPSTGNAGLYIYREDVLLGKALKKNVFVDGKCIGQTAPGVFFYEEVKGGEKHKISTESEFSPNDLLVDTEAGKYYFIRQYIKMGVFVGGANVEQVDEATGKAAVAFLKMAVKGTCSK